MSRKPPHTTARVTKSVNTQTTRDALLLYFLKLGMPYYCTSSNQSKLYYYYSTVTIFYKESSQYALRCHLNLQLLFHGFWPC